MQAWIALAPLALLAGALVILDARRQVVSPFRRPSGSKEQDMNFTAFAADPAHTILERSYHGSQESAARAACSRIPARLQPECLDALAGADLRASPRSGASVSFGVEGYMITVTRN